MLTEVIGAIKARDLSKVRSLLNENPTLVSGRTPEGESPLLASIYYGVAEARQLLLELGAEPTLFEAAAAGLTDRVKALTQEAPSLVAAYSPDGFTPLHLAAFFGNAETARYLITQGAAVDARSTNGLANMPLHAALAGSRDEVARVLVEAGAGLNTADASGNVPLHLAAANGNAELVSLLLARGAQLNVHNHEGQTPLGLALIKGHPAVADLLRQAGGQEA